MKLRWLLFVVAALSLALAPMVSADPGVVGGGTPQASNPTSTPNNPVSLTVDSSPDWAARASALEAELDAAAKAAAGTQSVGTLAIASKLSAGASLAATPPGFKCLPTCAENDARFLVISGSNLESFVGGNVVIDLAAPAGASSLEIGIFDGESGGRWDLAKVELKYTLYADKKDGSARTFVGQWLGNSVNATSGPQWTASSATMPDNDWWMVTVQTSSAAQAPSGNYFYTLEVELAAPATVSYSSAFKVGTNGVAVVNPAAFQVIGEINSLDDASIIYPGYPTSKSPTTYDGIWNFYLDVPTSQPFFSMWDGDLDYGSYDCVLNDTNDQDTPDNILPPWAGTGTAYEGVAIGVACPSGSGNATGNPPDDKPDGWYNRAPSINYTVFDSLGNSFLNDNPSGNSEWEQFRIDSTATTRAQADYSVAGLLPSGTYKVQVNGMDLINLSAFRFYQGVLCVDADGAPCTPLRPYKVGDTVWYDTNGNHVQDAGEPGIAGVVMNLLDSNGTIIATTTTDATGQYFFPVEGQRYDSVLGSDGQFQTVLVVDGKYTVQVVSGNFDSGNPLNGLTATTDSPEQANTVINANVLTYDFGYRGVVGQSDGSIGNEVWLDSNSNGVYEPALGETGIAGVTVALERNVSGNWVAFATTTTGADGSGCGYPPGNYCFDRIPDGTYRVSIVAASLPAGLVSTTPSPVVDLNNNSKPTGGYAITLVNGLAPNWDFADFGYKSRTTHKIGNLVWVDCDGDGVYDGPAVADLDCTCVETGVSGVTLALKDLAGTVLATTTTAANGTYYFPGLQDGTYIVDVTDSYGKLTGYVHTLGDQSQDVDNNSKAEPYTVVMKGKDVLTADFGYTQKTGTIGNQVWKDSDGDGRLDYGETGIAGVTVQLYWDSDNNGSYETLADTKTTAWNGQYWFSNLAAGKYQVKVIDASGPLAAMQLTVGDQNQTVDNTSKANPYPVSLSQGQTVQTADFGYKNNVTYKIGNLVWVDCDGDGVYDGAAVADLNCTCVETGIAGVTLDLVKNGNVIATTTTAANGTYYFTGLANGDYTVNVTDIYHKLDGYVHTLGNQSQAVDNTSKADPYNLTVNGADVLTVDFGYTQQTGKIGNQVWNDSDGDARFEYGEAGIAGVTLSLYRDTANNGSYSTLVGTTTTSSNGQYWFSNLAAGKYKVVVTDTADKLAGMVHTLGDQSLTVDNTSKANPYLVTLTGGQTVQTADFGYKNNVTYKIGNLVWVDCDGDGVYDGAAVADLNCTCVETGIAGVTLDLLKNGNVIATTTTAANGTYYFTGLANGDYTVNVTDKNHKLDGYVHTLGNQSQAVDNTSKADPYNLTVNGADVLTVDFGYTQKTGSIGNQVWSDSDGDGRLDYGEAGIAGVTLSLYRDTANNGSYATLVGTTTTSSNGQYWFSNLAAGKYKVVVTDTADKLAGMVHTLGDQSLTADNTSKANPYLVTLTGGQTVQTADFGYKNNVTHKIGNLVWVDCDGDGVYDGTAVADLDCTCVETGIAGVTVSLYNGSTATGMPRATTTTAANGTYYFTGLPDGVYTVKVTEGTGPLAGMTHTTGSQMLDNTSKDNPFTVTLNGADNLTADFGYRTTATGTGPGTGTLGFWKNHPDDWPVATITVGGRTYTKAQAIFWMSLSVGDDKTISMFQQLVSAKLNVAAGNTYSCVSAVITNANTWMTAHPVNSDVTAGSSAWAQASAWHQTLDDYNNGLLCAPHRN